MPKLTLEDIAEIAGVSRSTASRVINDQLGVSDNTRERVWEVIKRTGFQPHAAARTLASQRSRTLGLLLPHSVSFLFADPFFPQLTQGIAQACNQANYTLALFLVGTKEDEKMIYPRISRNGFLDGVIVQAGHHGDQWIIGRLVEANVPFVVVGRPFRSDNVSFIDIDNLYASYNAVDHLIRLGRQRIGTIAGPASSAVGIDRKEGYQKALLESGREVIESLIVEGDFTEVGGYRAMQQLLPVKPDAVFSASDTMAIGAMRAVREAGLRIPEDIAFVGFDDLPIATLSDIRLTTVHQSVDQLSIKAVDVLIDLIENGINPPRHIILNTELIIRESCGAARID